MHPIFSLDGLLGRHQRLSDHLAAEDALPASLGRIAAIEIVFQPFQRQRLRRSPIGSDMALDFSRGLVGPCPTG